MMNGLKILVLNNGTCLNKGCQALSRSLIKIITSRINSEVQFTFMTPTNRYDQWAMRDYPNVRFIFNLGIHRREKYLSQLLPYNIPRFMASYSPLFQMISSHDVVVSSGGDTLTSDYGSQNLAYQFQLLRFAKKLKKPVFLMAGTLGPYKEQDMSLARKVLNQIDAITVREPESLSYLKKGLGLSRGVHLTADPAFLLDAQEVDFLKDRMEQEQKPKIGFSLSSGIIRYAQLDFNTHLKSYINVINELTVRQGFEAVLLPHCTDRIEAGNDDRQVCDLIYRNCKKRDSIIYPGIDLNACEIKYVISRCAVFVGERMHATIAALSSGIPTLSVSYSTKSVGINQYLFGHTNYVMRVHEVRADSMLERIQHLLDNQTSIKNELSPKISFMKDQANLNGELFVNFLSKNGF